MQETQETGLDPWIRKIPWSRKWQPTPVYCQGNSIDRGTWWARVHGVAKSRTRISDQTTKYGSGASLMAQ